MACFYQMDEQWHGRHDRPPFEQKHLWATVGDYPAIEIVKEPVGLPGIGNIIPGQVKIASPLSPRNFFTLRVCKDCRADWIDAIDRWFGQGRRMAERFREDE
tara:strand:- start:209 stop:514 length:306 start_codon:yes stop_codon:yes gene_type:complete